MHVFLSKRRERGSVRAESMLTVVPFVGDPRQVIALPDFPRQCGFTVVVELGSGKVAAEGARPACEFEQEPRFVMWIVEAVASS